MKRILVVETGGRRLDAFLAASLPGYSRAFLKDMVERGHVLVDGERMDPDERVEEGSRVRVELPETKRSEKADFEGWVLHEDAQLLVLDKPAGLLMHPLGDSWLERPDAAAAGVETNLAAELQAHRPGILAAGTPRCGIVHRLDRPTSGVLVVAKDPAAWEALVSGFRDRRMEKTYRAIVRGIPSPRVRVQAPIGRNPASRKVVVTALGKSAETAFRVVSKKKAAALVEAKPLTGRTHQIRAHLAYLGHPVAGDPEFDRAGTPTPPRLMLHAYKLAFAHPRTGKAVAFEAAPPKDFAAFWQACK